MKITISGTAGSGKSTASKMLAKKLNLNYYGIGEIARKTANEKKMSLIEFTKYLESHKSYNKKFNESIKKLNNKNNFVLDSRIGVLFIKNSVNIFLDADLNERARRIFKDKRKLENFKTVDDVKKEIKKRNSLEKKMIYNLYKFDFMDMKHYDLIINTTGMVVKDICNIINRFLKKRKLI
jgi:cytidylate kinase